MELVGLGLQVEPIMDSSVLQGFCLKQYELSKVRIKHTYSFLKSDQACIMLTAFAQAWLDGVVWGLQVKPIIDCNVI